MLGLPASQGSEFTPYLGLQGMEETLVCRSRTGQVAAITGPKLAFAGDQLGCRILSLNLESQTFHMRNTWIKFLKHKALSSSVHEDYSEIIKIIDPKRNFEILCCPCSLLHIKPCITHP